MTGIRELPMKSTENQLKISREIAEAVADAGGRAYFVGGMVRDRLAGLPGTPDADIEVHGIAPERLKEILERFGGAVAVGESFGIYTIRGGGIDVAMPRTEKATGRGHRDFETYVDPFLGVKKAAERRDFTVNSMMEDILTGEIIDSFGGRADLEAKILRHVSDRSFPEDPLRVLRGAQFCARFGLTPAPETVELCRTIDVGTLPAERVAGELKKGLFSGKPSVFFDFLKETGHLSLLFPEVAALDGLPQDPLFHPEGDVFVHTMKVLDEAAALRERARQPWPFMLSALFHDLGKATTTSRGDDGRIHSYGHEKAGSELAETAVRRITNEKNVIKYVKNAVLMHMMPNTLALQNSSVKATNRMFDRSVEPFDLILLGLADSRGIDHGRPYIEAEGYLLERFEIYERTMAAPHVTGEDLIAAGIKPGPVFREALGYAHKLRLAGIPRDNALTQTLRYAKKAAKEGQQRKN